MATSARYHSLLAAVLNRAIEDLKGTDPRCGRQGQDRAMIFIMSDTCEAYCMALGVDHEAVRKKAAALYRRIVEKAG